MDADATMEAVREPTDADLYEIARFVGISPDGLRRFLGVVRLLGAEVRAAPAAEPGARKPSNWDAPPSAYERLRYHYGIPEELIATFEAEVLAGAPGRAAPEPTEERVHRVWAYINAQDGESLVWTHDMVRDLLRAGDASQGQRP